LEKLKLRLKSEPVNRAKEISKEIVEDLMDLIRENTTTSIERTVLRLFGIIGADIDDTPYVNIIVKQLMKKGVLEMGASLYVLNACVHHDEEPEVIAKMVAEENLDLTEIPMGDYEKINALSQKLTQAAMDHIAKIKDERDKLLYETWSDPPRPYKYVIVATGNIHEDVVQAQAAARQGADIIAVIRSTAQSLLDYVPEGATTEGFGGTYATQENFRIMRKALDVVGEEQNRYIRLVNYASGLCMPEIAMMGAWEGLDFLLNDSMYGILFRDINMQRTIIDQYFSRLICAASHITINTGEDNYLTTSDAIEKAYAVTASQLINEAFALKAGMEPKYMGLGHAFEINPDIKDGLSYEIAHALLTRELFPEATLKYMPPTKHMTGDIFKGYAMNTMFNFVSVLTGQDIQLLGMLTEAIHTPFMQDRYLAVKNADYIFNNAFSLGKEFSIDDDSFISQRAHKVLEQAIELLEHTREVGLMQSIEEANFADIKRTQTGGKGLDGVIKKSPKYYNPFEGAFRRLLNLDDEVFEGGVH
jgi:beta-lysine 5,6-aminomutase alpha subunit